MNFFPSKNTNYPFVRAWAILQNADTAFIKAAVGEARVDDAPSDAVHRTLDGWKRFDDMPREIQRDLLLTRDLLGDDNEV